jgi:hypothetical protein
VQVWRQAKEAELLSLIPASIRAEQSIDAENLPSFLTLATAVFAGRDNRRLSSTTMRYPAILVEGNAYSRPYGLERIQHVTSFLDFVTKEARDELFWNLMQKPRWNGAKNMTFFTDAIAVLKAAIRACGMDPATTTHSQFQEVNPLLRCVYRNCRATGDALNPTAYMRLSAALKHWMQHHQQWNVQNDFDEMFEKVEDEEALEMFATLSTTRSK